MNNRINARVPVEPQCKATVQFNQQRFRDLKVSDLGPQGCCIHVPFQLARGLRNNPSLDWLALTHPSFSDATRNASTGAKVAWIASQQDLSTGLVATGVRFEGAPAGFTEGLAAFVRAWEKYERLATGLDGMPA